MAKDESRGGLGGDALQVGAIPGGDRRRKQAGRRSEFLVGVEAYAEAICIVLSSPSVLGK
jgi:hypothetical protein